MTKKINSNSCAARPATVAPVRAIRTEPVRRETRAGERPAYQAPRPPEKK